MNLLQDLRFAARSLRARVGMTAFAVLTLATGMAAALAIYCVIDALLLRALPYPQPDQLVQIRSAECTACMACVASCPAENALALALPPRKAETAAGRWKGRTVGPMVAAGLVAYVFLSAVLVARATNHWRSDMPRQVYIQLVPKVNQFGHPGM